MDDWTLSIAFHWPHDRFALGWQMVKPEEGYNYWTFTVFLFIATLELNV